MFGVWKYFEGFMKKYFVGWNGNEYGNVDRVWFGSEYINYKLLWFLVDEVFFSFGLFKWFFVLCWWSV